MKQLLIVLIFSAITGSIRCQNMNGFFRNHGVSLLADVAHPFDTFQSGSYDVRPDYVLVNIYYDGGYSTQLRIDRGFGSLYFSRLQVLHNENTVDAFLAIRILAVLVIQLQRQTDPRQYEEMQRNCERIFGSRMENWTGIQLALFALNLEYLDN